MSKDPDLAKALVGKSVMLPAAKQQPWEVGVDGDHRQSIVGSVRSRKRYVHTIDNPDSIKHVYIYTEWVCSIWELLKVRVCSIFGEWVCSMLITTQVE